MSASGSTLIDEAPMMDYFPFLELPECIRLKIYRYALASTGVIYCRVDWWYSSWELEPAAKPEICVNLLRTCSKVYCEASITLYQENTTVIASAECGFWSRTQFWRRSRYAHLLQQSTQVFIMIDVKRPFPLDLLEALRKMGALRMCRFSLATEDFTGPDEVPEFLHDVLGVIPPDCKVIFGAGDASMISNHVRSTYSDEIVYGGKQWLQVNSNDLIRVLKPARDSSGSTRSCFQAEIPSSGHPLEDHESNCYDVTWGDSMMDENAMPDTNKMAVLHKRSTPTRFTRFFDLPAELRLRIYEYTLAPEGSIGFMNGGLSPPRLDVLRACRQIYEEANDIVFTFNAFCCHGPIPNIAGSLNECYLHLPSKIKRLFLVLSVYPMGLQFSNVDDEYASIAVRLEDFTALQHIRVALYDRNRKIGQPIPQAAYKLRERLEARGVHVAFGSSTVWDKRFIDYQLGKRVSKGEIDPESIEAGSVLR